MSQIWHHPIAARVTGESHLSSGTECQDSFDHWCSPDNEWIAVTVCDGAGSSKHSGTSSQFIAERFTDELRKIGLRLSKSDFGLWVTDAILNAVLTIRKDLREFTQSDDLADYHTTLVAILLGPPRSLGGRAGLGIHIGDGAIFGGDIGHDRETAAYNLDEKFYIFSPPENGEYANETYFVTENQWIKRIRVTPLLKTDWIALATDGGCSVAMSGSRRPRAPFIPNLFTQVLSADTDSYDLVLKQMLADTNLRNLTDDDKTIVMILDIAKFNRVDFPFALKEHPETELNLKVFAPSQEGAAESSELPNSPAQNRRISRLSIRKVARLGAITVFLVTATLSAFAGIVRLGFFPESLCIAFVERSKCIYVEAASSSHQGKVTDPTSPRTEGRSDDRLKMKDTEASPVKIKKTINAISGQEITPASVDSSPDRNTLDRTIQIEEQPAKQGGADLK